MPPKTTTCSVCGQEVLKSQTLEVSPGKRACRSHEGTVETATQAQQAAKDAKVAEDAARAKAAEAKRRSWLGGLDSDPEGQAEFWQKQAEWRIWTENHCWTCGKPGESMRDFFFAVLVAQKKLELKGEFNFFTLPEDLRREMGERTVLAVLPYDDEKDYMIRRHLVDKKIKSIIHFLRCVRMCNHCIEKAGVQKRLEEIMPHPTMEQLYAVMPVVAALDPLLTELATQTGEN
jgi:hypothetical protein